MFTGSRQAAQRKTYHFVVQFLEGHMKQRSWHMNPWQRPLEGQVKRTTLVLTIIVVFLGAAIGRAQNTTSAVNGTVTDSTGAVVAGAGISATNTATGVVYRSTTDNLGSYHVTQLPPGSYTMEVVKTGFETQKVQAFKLFVDQQFQQNIALAVGQATQTVSATAAELLLATQASHQG